MWSSVSAGTSIKKVSGGRKGKGAPRSSGVYWRVFEWHVMHHLSDDNCSVSHSVSFKIQSRIYLGFVARVFILIANGNWRTLLHTDSLLVHNIGWALRDCDNRSPSCCGIVDRGIGFGPSYFGPSGIGMSCTEAS
jgi:hypothetical protein